MHKLELNKGIVVFLSIFILVLNLRQNTHAQSGHFYDKKLTHKEGIEESPHKKINGFNTLRGQHIVTKPNNINIKKIEKSFNKDLKILISIFFPFIFIWIFLSIGVYSTKSDYNGNPDNLDPIGNFVPYDDSVYNNMNEKIKKQEKLTRVTPIR